MKEELKSQEMTLGYDPERCVYTAIIPSTAVQPLLATVETMVEQTDTTLSDEGNWLYSIGRAPDDSTYAVLLGHSQEKDLILTAIDAETIGHLVMSKLFLSVNPYAANNQPADIAQQAA